jgi:DNA-binding CsgD family transcriptional regulator
MFSSIYHFCFYLMQNSYKQHLGYSFFILSICISFFVKNFLILTGIDKEFINILSMLTMFINSIAFSFFCYTLFDLQKLKTYMISSLSLIFFLCLLSILIFILNNSYIYQIFIFYLPLLTGLLIFTILFINAFIKSRYYEDKWKMLFFISILVFMMTQIPAAFIKWSVNQDTNHFFLFAAVPIMILFEIGLLNIFRVTEKKIRNLENEIIRLQNDMTFDLQFNEKCNAYSLTDREKQVTRFLIEGKEIRDISNELDIAYNTVRNFKQKIYYKLNVKNMIELLNIFIKPM